MSSAARPANEVRRLLGLAEGNRLLAGLALLLLAVAASLAALLLFPRQPQTGAAWVLHLAGMALLAMAVPVLIRAPREAKPAEPLTFQVAIFGLVVLGLAVFMRFYRLGEVPFGTWFDEADIGLRAQRILLEPAYRPAFLRGHALAYYLPALIALSFKLIGMSTLAIRAVTALFGLGSVVLAFFLGREIYGNRFGLLLAFFLAIARWAVTFDRLGMATSSGPFFILLVLLLLIRGRRASDARYLVWAGLAAGIGLGFHSSLRLFWLLILALLAWWSAGQLRESVGQPGRRAAWAISISLFILAALVAAGPLIQVAVRQPGDFWSRAQQVSIFEKRDEPNLVQAIASNTVKNALMFNGQGDRNGRHNLPGQPMLDPLTGALFVLGLALAITRYRRPVEMLFLLTFVVGLAGAILTVDFESPQSQRAVGAMASVFFLAALAAEGYWRVLERWPSPFWARPLGMVLLLAGGAASVYGNTNTYFVRQANDNSVWQEHSAVETLAGNQMRALDEQGAAIYLSMFLQGHPTIRFLAPEAEAKLVAGPDILPLREPGDRPVAVLVGLQEAWIAEAVDAFYPNAQVTAAASPDGAPVQYTVVVPPEDIRQVQGLQADYWPGSSAESAPQLGRIEAPVNARWPAEAPLNEPFVAKWQGVLYAPEFGEYRLQLESPGAASLWLDGQALIETNSGGKQRVARTLAQGNHTLRLSTASGEGLVRLAWQRPSADDTETIPPWALYHGPQVASRGLLGAFYEGGDWQAQPALQRIDPFIDAYFHLIPLERPYGVTWSGQIEIPEAGSYTFGLEVNGQAQLYLGDQLVIDAPRPTPYQEGTISLDAGWHDLRLQFLDDTGGSRLHLYWTPPGQTRQIIPSDVLRPALTPE